MQHELNRAPIPRPVTELKKKFVSASAGSRTRIDCLEGNHANRYTTDAHLVTQYQGTLIRSSKQGHHDAANHAVMHTYAGTFCGPGCQAVTFTDMPH